MLVFLTACGLLQRRVACLSPSASESFEEQGPTPTGTPVLAALAARRTRLTAPSHPWR